MTGAIDPADVVAPPEPGGIGEVIAQLGATRLSRSTRVAPQPIST
jgi:hypothetical protein